MINTDHMILRRYAKGMTQADLAHRAGLTKDHICRLECGKVNASLPTVIRLCDVLETEPNMMLLWSKKER